MSTPREQFYRIRGVVLDSRTRRGIEGLRVEAWDKDPLLDDCLGSAVADAGGTFEIPFAAQHFREFFLDRKPDLYFRVYRGDELLTSTEHLVLRDVSTGEIPVTISVANGPGEEVPAVALGGHVVLEHGGPAEGLRLRLYQHSFGGAATLVGEATTGAEGRYSLPAGLDGRAAALLEVRAVDTAGAEVPLSRPLADLVGAERMELNLVAPAGLQPMEPEYDRLSADLMPHVGRILELAEATENAERQDLTVLNRATGWDARLIGLAATAARLSADRDVELHHEALYGLLRAGLPSDKLLLAQVDPDVAERALKTVRDAGIVRLTDEQIGETRQGFTTFASRVRLAVPAPGSASSYGELLQGSGLSPEAQARFAPVYLGHRGGAAELWDRARDAGLDDAQIGRLQLHGKLAFLAGNSAPMTAHLVSQQIHDPVELVERDFHEPGQWKAEATALAGGRDEALATLIPAGYAGDTVAERLDAYADDMARKVRLSYPTHVVGRMIEQDVADAFGLGAARAATATLLKSAAGQGFRLGRTPVAAFLDAHAGAGAGMARDKLQAAQRQLKTVHRVYQITPGNEGMPVLLSLGMTSAYDVTAQPEAAFVQLYMDKYLELHGRKPPPGEAELVYRKAKQVSSVTYSLFAIASKLGSEAPVYGVSAPAPVRDEVRSELIRQFPSMESLFGSMDYGECEHCRSVLSPAAYLVDLLQFVDPEPEAWANFLAHWKATHGGQEYTARYRKPYDALVERRPDLPHLALTCENTETALPYIDLVNEILEYFVAHGKLAEEAAHDTGDASTAELLAEPQNVVGEAYDRLAAARYPLNLPFDLWIETVREFCNRFETPLAEMLEAFRTGDELFAPARPFDRARIFAESLGLSPVETAIFTDPDPLADDRWHALYGLPSARPPLQDVTNAGRATLTLANADARSFREGMVCAYFDIGGATLQPETQAIAEIGLPDSGGAGRTTVTLEGTWSTPPGAGDLLVCDGVATLQSARTLSRRLGVTYRELVEIAQSAFVNPLLPRLGILHKLGVSVHDARFYLDHRAKLALDPTTLSTQDQQRRLEAKGFADALARLATRFAFTAAELETEVEAIAFDAVLVLADPDSGPSFDLTTLRYADGRAADPITLLRINLLVRLWRRLGWSLEETDRALQAFVPANAPFDAAHLAKQPLATALIYLAHLKRLDGQLAAGKQSRLKLITLWSDLAVTGKKPLYAQLFLTRGVPKGDPVFDDPLGRYLSPAALAAMAESRTHVVQLGNVALADRIDPAPFAAEPKLAVWYDALEEVQHLSFVGVLGDTEKAALGALSPSSALAPLLDAVQAKAREFLLVRGHLPALQGALGLTADDVGRILEDTGGTLAAAELSLRTVSTLYRYGLLARALKLSVRELIALRQMSGLDPFRRLHSDPLSTLDQDFPFTDTLRFVEIAGEARESGLKIDELEYLLRHRFDEAGPYRPDRGETLALVKAMADGIRAIRNEHAVPDDPGAMSDDALRQKLGLALPADVVERFMAMLNGTAEFTATRGGVATPLPPSAFAVEPAIGELRHNLSRQEQKLTFRGVLFNTRKQALLARLPLPVPPNPHVPSPVLGDLLDSVQLQAREFFTANLRKQPAGVQPAGGFLDDADYGLLFDPDLPLAVGETEQDRVRSRRTRLASAFLPFLQDRLIRQLVVETMVARTGADPALVESLVTDQRVLAVGTAPLLDAFAATGAHGVTATFFASTNGTGPSTTATLADADIGVNGTDGQLIRPPGTNSARLEGYLYVPAPGAYRFQLTLEQQNARAELRFAHLPDPVLWSGAAAADGAVLGDGAGEFLELKPGVPYGFTLLLNDLNGGEARLRVQGESLPEGSLAQLAVHPLAVVEEAERAAGLLAKVLQLLQRLGVGEREARYLRVHAAAFDGLDPGGLPVAAGDDTPAGARALFGQFLRLAGYARLKRDLAGDGDDLVDVFEANGTGDLDRVYTLVAGLARRGPATVAACARALFSTPDFASEKPLQRLWEALQVVERIGAPVASLLDWLRIVNPAATAGQRQEIAHALKESVKARLEPETWRRVAQPVFDRLRQRGRDALAAHVMHQHGFARLEQLYEYFLVDPGMEPVVQTSRIRQSIGSLQLFIQRCLLNLEPQVHPSAIDARQWEWMKRYRVWEANRKIFLFPENWLEPEFRDDKTHLFAELEGSLLQDDVSSDLAEDAFLDYLRKLDELARLDVVAMHLDDDDDPARRTLHVIGRTFAQPHRYFYRRYAHQMWTPWEPVTAEIEGDHLAPVVWRDRLYLFWVTFLEKVAAPQGDIVLTEPAKSVTIPASRRDVEAHLHWSEYLQGEWSTRQSSGINAPAPIVSKGLLSFKPELVFVHVSKAYEQGEERGVYVHLSNPIGQSFYLAGRNSTPVPAPYGATWPQGARPENPYTATGERATRYSGKGVLRVRFKKRLTTEPGKPPTVETPPILQEGRAYTLLPCDNNVTLGAPASVGADAPAAVQAAIERGLPEIASLMKPVFYQDDTHTLFIEPQVTEQTIEEWQEWVTRIPQTEQEWEKPKWWEELAVIPVLPWKTPIPDPVGPPGFRIDPGSLIQPRTSLDWLANPGTTLLFDGALIGPRGRPGLEIRTAGDARPASDVPVSINPGSGIVAGSTVVLADAVDLRNAGLAEVAGGLNVVGAAGFNSALGQNLGVFTRSRAAISAAGPFAVNQGG